MSAAGRRVSSLAVVLVPGSCHRWRSCSRWMARRALHRWRFLVPVIVGGRALDGWRGGRVSLHRWRFLVPVIVGGCQDQQQGRRLSSLVNDGGAVVLSMTAAGAAELCTMTARRRVSLWCRSIVGGSWFLSSLAAVRISSRGGGPRPREGGGGIRRATGPPGGGESRCSVAAVSLEIERLQVLVLKEEYLKANELRRQAGPCFLNKIVRMQQICRKYSQKAGSNAAF